jgi:hypothetical protein
MDACEFPTGYPCKENFPGQPFANRGSHLHQRVMIPGMTISGTATNSGNLPLERCLFAQIGSRSAAVGGGGCNEVQGGYRLHSR